MDKIGRPAIAINLPKAGSYKLGVAETVTVEDLRNVNFDDPPPQFSAPLPSYCLGGATPDPATGICANVCTDGYPRVERNL